ncbi:unnamed protein product [Allacma fusca]|uniref:PKS/mFAS DH domain-containing protein n=1 Tax=Allacma fusca TaxID=39272 RepID=A0A8J2P3R6_9HEXA|nr:unnamed protein product [Allacma fusca]
MVLKNNGVDLKSILETQDPDSLNNLQNAFVAIVACQIALTDVLKSLDIVPDGKMYFAGCSPKFSALYDPLKFPVSVETPSISSLIKWDHLLSWDVPQYRNEMSVKTGTKFSINLTTDESLSGHIIEDKIVFPAAGYIWLVWKTFAKLQSVNLEELPIHFENMNFKRVTELHPKCSNDFIVSIFSESGDFEVVESKEIVCTGTIRKANKFNGDMLTTNSFASADYKSLDKEDFYKLLRLKGYNYQGFFRGVQNVELEGTWAKIDWHENWTCFLDAILQTQILRFYSNDIIVPIRLETVTIDPIMFRKSLRKEPNTIVMSHCKHSGVVRTTGIRITGIKTSTIMLYKSPAAPSITVQKFRSYVDTIPVTTSKEDVLAFFIGIVVENSHGLSDQPFIFTELLNASHSIDPAPSILYLKFPSVEHRVIQKNCGNKHASSNRRVFESITDVKSLSRCHLVKIEREEEIFRCTDLLHDGGFLALCTPHEFIISKLIVVARRRTENEYIYLMRKCIKWKGKCWPEQLRCFEKNATIKINIVTL